MSPEKIPLDENLKRVVTQISTEFKRVYARQGNLVSLSTTEKASLVGAINELGGLLSGLIDDGRQTASNTYSANKILSLIAEAKSSLIGGAGLEFDTFKEIQDFLASNGSAYNAINQQLSSRLRFDADQPLTVQQQAQGQKNLNVYSKSEIGDTSVDLVAVFKSGLL